MEVKEKIKRRMIEKMTELGAEKDYTEMSYDELYNEIMMNTGDIDTLMLIAESLRFNEILTDYQREKLLELIDKYATKVG